MTNTEINIKAHLDMQSIMTYNMLFQHLDSKQKWTVGGIVDKVRRSNLHKNFEMDFEFSKDILKAMSDMYVEVEPFPTMADLIDSKVITKLERKSLINLSREVLGNTLI
jgi:hypothetical protein